MLTAMLVLGGGGLLWYLSETAEFSRAPNPSTALSKTPPKASPARPLLIR
jgi:hypothetical protein